MLKKTVFKLFLTIQVITLIITSNIIAKGNPKPILTLKPGNATMGLVWYLERVSTESEVKSYIVIKDSQALITLEPEKQSYLVAELDNGQDYTFQIQAIYQDNAVTTSEEVTAAPIVLPRAPTNLVAEVEETNEYKINLTWEASKRGTFPIQKYIIERTILEDNFYDEPITIDPNTNYIDTQIDLVTAFDKYFYRIAAVDIQGNQSDYSETIMVEALKENVPEPPQGFRMMAKNQGVMLSWNSLPNITEYKIFYGEDIKKIDKTITVNTNNYEIDNLKNFTTYYFYLAAVSNEVLSSRVRTSGKPIGLPSKVETLSAYPAKTYIKLTWNNTLGFQEEVTNYKIYRGESTSSTKELITINSDNKLYIDEQPLNTLAYYAIKAVNSAGESESQIILEPVLPDTEAVPSTPTNFQAVLGQSQTIKFYWEANPSSDQVINYVIQGKSEILEVTWSWEIPGIGNTTAEATNLHNGIPYTFELKAKNKQGESQPSALEVAPLAPPKDFKAEVKGNNILLTWQAGAEPSGAKYEIYSTDANHNPEKNYLVQTNNLAYADTVSKNGYYYYKLVALNQVEGWSAEKDQRLADEYALMVNAQVAVAPGRPGKLVAIPQNEKVELYWQAVTNVENYIIYRYKQRSTDTDFDLDTKIKVAYDLVSLVDGPGLTNTVKYKYCISCVNEVGESLCSEYALATPYTEAKLPSDTTINIKIEQKQVHLEWSASIAGDYPIIGYNIYRSLDGGGTFNLLGEAPTVKYIEGNKYTYQDTTTGYNKVYIYRLHAIDQEFNEGPAYILARATMPVINNDLKVYRNAFNPMQGEKLPLQLIQSQAGKVVIKIYNLTGEYIRELWEEDIQGNYDESNPYISSLFYWDGKNHQGQIVASGVYVIAVKGEKIFFQTKRVAIIK